MDLREAADILGVHYQTACAWVREAPRLIHVRDWVAQAQALYPAITGGQETRARHQVDRLASGVRHIGLCEQVIAPALRRLGDDWAAGRVSIAQEHRASAICERLLASQARQPAGRFSCTTAEAARRAQEEARFVAVRCPTWT